MISVTQQSTAGPQSFIGTVQYLMKTEGAGSLLTKGLKPRLARMGLLSGVMVWSLDQCHFTFGLKSAPHATDA